MGRSDMTPRFRLSVALGAVILTCIFGCSRSDSRADFLSSLPRYERVVRSMDSGNLPIPAQFGKVQLAPEDARLAQDVFAGRDTNGVLTVIFFTRSGFPALHSGYMYRSSGEAGADFKSRWPGLEKVTNKWFYISN